MKEAKDDCLSFNPSKSLFIVLLTDINTHSDKPLSPLYLSMLSYFASNLLPSRKMTRVLFECDLHTILK